MLQCTPAAAAVLDEARRRNSLPDTFGVRVFAAQSPQGEVGLGIDFVEEPAANDQVTHQHGTKLMVAPEVSAELEELTLDVRSDPSADGQAPAELVLRRS